MSQLSLRLACASKPYPWTAAFSTHVLTALKIALGTAVSFAAALPAAAADFTYQDAGTNLQLSFDAVEVSIEGNTRRVSNYSIFNAGDTPIENAAYVRPFAWSLVPGQTPIFGLDWSNEKDGWFTEDYDGAGNGLLVRLTSLRDRIRLGDLADSTGLAPLPLTQPCTTSPAYPQDSPR